jgi:hypothetical protein
MQSNKNLARLEIVETVSSICWFSMDASWMLGLQLPAQIMATLTVIFSLLVFRYTERSWPNLFVNAAMNCWAFMNIFWMLSEFKAVGCGLLLAQVSFGIGAFCLICAAFSGASIKDALEVILARFRRFRVPRQDEVDPGDQAKD